MSATSVTGVGNGAAGPVRGPGNNRNQYASLLDPHIVFHGTAYMDNNDITIDLPVSVRDVPEKLTILCAGKAFGIYKEITDGILTGFTISGAKKRDVDFVVVKSPSGLFIDGDYGPVFIP